MSVTVHFEVKEAFQLSVVEENIAACLERIFKEYPEASIRIVSAVGDGVPVDPRPEAPSTEEPTPVGHA